MPTVPGPPVFPKACHLDPRKLASVKAEFLKMEKGLDPGKLASVKAEFLKMEKAGIV